MPVEVLVKAVIAGLLASLACGFGVLPLFVRRIDPAKHTGLGYAFAGGLMFSASVYNLILPGLNMGEGGWRFADVLPIVVGTLLGAAFLATAEARLFVPREKEKSGDRTKRMAMLVFLAMTVHSIPEGVAVGVGYAAETHDPTHARLGLVLALAIAIHNVPEGLAVAIPLRSGGANLARCFAAAVITSLPQPVAAIPAVLLAWFFEPLMPLLMGFAAGAMIFLVVLELIPEALHTEKPARIAWAFILGFCLMLLVQVIL